MKPQRRITPYHILLTLLIALILSSLFAAGPISAQGGGATPAATRAVTDNDVNRVSRNLYCPVCQNVPLEVCETEACARWRDQVRDLLAQGYTDEQVRQYFVEHFGTKTVGTPTNTLSQVLTVVLPFALVGLFGAAIVVTLLRWRHRRDMGERPSPVEADTAPLDDYRARLEDEIRGGE